MRLFWYHHNVQVLGPGKRLCFWVQGCSHHCKGCLSPHTWDPQGGKEVPLSWVKTEIEKAKLQGEEGLTISGGEPLEQPEALFEIAEFAKSLDLGIILYSGYEEAEVWANADMCSIAERCDLLILGRYVDEKNDGKPLVGSSNQQVVFVTDRYRRDWEQLAQEERKTETVISIEENGVRFDVIGVPGKKTQQCDRR